MLTTLATAAIEQVLNKLLALEPSLSAALAPVEHKVLSVEVRDWQRRFAITFTGKQLMVYNNYQEQSDCLISTQLETLPQLKDPSVITQLIRQDKLDLEGDLHLAQAYSKAFSELDIDWAEHLSHYVGDAPAQFIFQLCQQKQNQLKHGALVAKHTTQQLCQDELKVAIHPLELQQFKTHTRALKQQTDQLEQRIARLLNH